jgi:antitoxin Phd
MEEAIVSTLLKNPEKHHCPAEKPSFGILTPHQRLYTLLTSLTIKGFLMKVWQLQDAKAQFSNVVRSAQREGPQAVSVHGKPAAVVVSAGEFERLTKKKQSSFLAFMRASPLVGVNLKIRRDKSPTRDIPL